MKNENKPKLKSGHICLVISLNLHLSPLDFFSLKLAALKSEKFGAFGNSFGQNV